MYPDVVTLDRTIVCIGFGAFWICNKMLSYGRLTNKFRTDIFAHTRWMFSYDANFCSDARANMLLYSVCCPLGSASYVPSFTLAQKFIIYTTFLSGSNAIFTGYGSITLVL